MLIVFPEAKILLQIQEGVYLLIWFYLVKIWKKPRCISGDNVLPLSRTHSHFQSCQPFPVPAPNPAASPSITGGGEAHGEGGQLSSLSTLTERITLTLQLLISLWKCFFFFFFPPQNAEWRKCVCWSSLFSLDNKLDVFQRHKQKVTKASTAGAHFCLFFFFSSLLSLLKEESFEGSKVWPDKWQFSNCWFHLH